jgi:hypothetical protein
MTIVEGRFSDAEERFWASASLSNVILGLVPRIFGVK